MVGDGAMEGPDNMPLNLHLTSSQGDSVHYSTSPGEAEEEQSKSSVLASLLRSTCGQKVLKSPNWGSIPGPYAY